MSPRTLALAGLAAVAVAVARPAAAAPTVPHTFTAGAPARAAEVNANFQAVVQAIAANMPVGTLLPFAGDVAPEGFLLCNGDPKGRGEYPALFAVIGVKYGPGDGSQTFNLPDLRSKTLVGAGQGRAGTNGAGALLTDRPLGATGGEEAHTLTASEMPAHTHTMGPVRRWVGTGGGFPWPWDGAAAAAIENAEVSTTGGGQPHATMPPFVTVNWIIKY